MSIINRAKGGVGKLIQAAMDAAIKARDANYIHVHTKPDRSAVIITTHVNGSDVAWITYDPQQLDELLRVLESHRRELL